MPSMPFIVRSFIVNFVGVAGFENWKSIRIKLSKKPKSHKRKLYKIYIINFIRNKIINFPKWNSVMEICHLFDSTFIPEKKNISLKIILIKKKFFN